MNTRQILAAAGAAFVFVSGPADTLAPEHVQKAPADSH